MYNNAMLSTYLNVYLDELDEQVQIMDEQLLDLERNGNHPAVLQTIFRAAHTLKGSSAVMGFDHIKNMTHKVETVFDGLRSNRLHTSSALMNTLFRCVDYLKKQRELFLQGLMEEQPIGDLLVQLDAFVKGEPHGAVVSGAGTVEMLPDYAAANGQRTDITNEGSDAPRLLPASFHETKLEEIRLELENGTEVILFEIRLHEAAELPFARALIIFEQLKEAGKVLAVSPDQPDLLLADQGSMLIGCLISECPAIHELRQYVLDMPDVHSVETYALTLDWLSDKQLQVQASGSFGPVLEEKRPPAGVKDNKFQATQTVRVDVNRLERLLNLVGELVIGQTRLQVAGSRLRELGFPDNGELSQLDEATIHIQRVVSELQDGVMKTRMLPIEQLFSRFPRLVRDLAQQVEKDIELVVEGKETELDRTLIEEISDPLIHILRNAVDHGMELPEDRVRSGKPRQGRIVIRASHEENSIAISVSDDGRGINADAIRTKAVQRRFVTEEQADRMTDKEAIGLIFHSGMSTAEQVTDLSGRGVGMDIVKTRIEKLNGVIDIDTAVGTGTSIKVKLPLTLAIIRSLLVSLGDFVLALPIVNVIEISRLEESGIKNINGQEMCMIRDELLPFVRMDRLLGIDRPAASGTGRLFVVTVGIGEQRACLLFDRSIANQEIVVKSLGTYIGQVPFISGSTIMGDGSIALILDVASIVRMTAQRQPASSGHAGAVSQHSDNESKRITFVIDSVLYGIVIQAVKEIVRVPDVAKTAHSDRYMLGLIQLRDQLLPLYQLGAILGHGAGETGEESRVLIVDTGSRAVGLLVDEVVGVSTVSRQSTEEVPAEVRAKQMAIDSVYRTEEQGLVFQVNVDVLKGMLGGYSI